MSASAPDLRAVVTEALLWRFQCARYAVEFHPRRTCTMIIQTELMWRSWRLIQNLLLGKTDMINICLIFNRSSIPPSQAREASHQQCCNLTQTDNAVITSWQNRPPLANCKTICVTRSGKTIRVRTVWLESRNLSSVVGPSPFLSSSGLFYNFFTTSGNADDQLRETDTFCLSSRQGWWWAKSSIRLFGFVQRQSPLYSLQ